MFQSNRYRPPRRGSVYLAVLGTSLIASVLALSALALQRIQNRQLSLSSDVRQAHLNAQAAIELGLLTIEQSANWRTTYSNTAAPWFTRSTGLGTSSLVVTDPIDGVLTDNVNEPFVMLGIGTSGDAVQRVELRVDPRSKPADVLATVANSGGSISGQSSAIDWNAVVASYQAAGTQIDYNSLPTATNLEFARNVSVSSNLNYWDNDPPGLPGSTFSGPLSFSGRSACLFVDRNDRRGGAGNRLQVALLKPNTSYQVSIEVHHDLSLLQANYFKVFMITEYSNGSYVESPGSTTQLSYLFGQNTWTTLTATITTPNWTEEPANVYLVVNSDHSSGNSRDFYVDNIHVFENTTGRFLYHQALGPSVTNPNGIYWIDCGGNKLLVERARILGTLVVINPGAGSAIANGPVHMAPATAGYPALLVSGDFAIRATNRGLSEAESGESGTNFNPTGIPYEFNNVFCAATDGSPNDIYPSEIQGLVAVSANLTFENQPRLRGEVVAGGGIAGTPNLEHRLDAVFSPPPGFTAPPAYDRRPGSARKAVQ